MRIQESPAAISLFNRFKADNTNTATNAMMKKRME
jgi:hypothetical protein